MRLVPKRQTSSTCKLYCTRYITKQTAPHTILPNITPPYLEVMIGHGAAAVELGVCTVAEEGTSVIDADILDVLELVHVLIWPVELLDLGREEIWALTR